jgi:hypothetical protein
MVFDNLIKYASIFLEATSKDEKWIEFPKTELNDIKNDLENNSKIITTRTKDEQGKYKPRKIYQSIFGKLKVKKVNTYNNIKNHPFYNELTTKQKNTISNSDKYDVVWLIPV